jgi:hypothetical protein
MAGATFSRVKTWTTETLTDSDLNAEFDNILNNLTPAGIDDESASDAAARATTDPYPAAAISKATSLQGELQRLRYIIAQITGETYWYIDPDNNIATLHADLETAKTNITNALVLTPALGSDHATSGPTATLTAGADLVFGDFCYMASTGKMAKGDADAIGTSGVFAMAAATIATDAAGVFALPGSFIRDDSWNWGTVGAYVYLDTATAGGLTQTAPTGTDDAIQIVGVAIHADRIYFCPQLLMYTHT